jgi:hypothetical protein
MEISCVLGAPIGWGGCDVAPGGLVIGGILSRSPYGQLVVYYPQDFSYTRAISFRFFENFAVLSATCRPKYHRKELRKP